MPPHLPERSEPERRGAPSHCHVLQLWSMWQSTLSQLRGNWNKLGFLHILNIFTYETLDSYNFNSELFLAKYHEFKLFRINFLPKRFKIFDKMRQVFIRNFIVFFGETTLIKGDDERKNIWKHLWIQTKCITLWVEEIFYMCFRFMKYGEKCLQEYRVSLNKPMLVLR